MALPQGWKQKSGEALLYQASYPNYQKGDSGTTSLNITTNKSNGNYDVYQPGLFGDTLIYSYNASNGQRVVKNQNLYEQIFVGSGTKAAQLESLDRRVRSETYQIAVDQRVGGQSSTTSRELEALKAKPGYKMFGDGTVQISPPADPQGGNPQPDPAAVVADENGAKLEAVDPEDTATAEAAKSLAAKLNAPEGGNDALLLRYPFGNLQAARELGISYDYIKITVVKNIKTITRESITADRDSTATLGAATQQYFAAALQGSSNLTQAYQVKQKALARIILPMQPNISSANSTNWGSDSANILQLVGGNFIYKYFSGIRENSNFIDSLSSMQGDLLQGLRDAAGMAGQEQQNIAALLAGQIVNANLLQRTTGTVINPNMELLFNGPRMRSFNFTFDMVPRFKEEAEQIRKIIKVFKKYMAPVKKPGNAFLDSPNIFLLDYIYNGDISDNEVKALYGSNGKSHPYLNKIKPCALTDFSVNYTPAGSYMTYRDGGSMTMYQISMTFSEIEPIYDTDYDLNKDDMGF
jgi:hypothetical protein